MLGAGGGSPAWTRAKDGSCAWTRAEDGSCAGVRGRGASRAVSIAMSSRSVVGCGTICRRTSILNLICIQFTDIFECALDKLITYRPVGDRVVPEMVIVLKEDPGRPGGVVALAAAMMNVELGSWVYDARGNKLATPDPGLLEVTLGSGASLLPTVVRLHPRVGRVLLIAPSAVDLVALARSLSRQLSLHPFSHLVGHPVPTAMTPSITLYRTLDIAPRTVTGPLAILSAGPIRARAIVYHRDGLGEVVEPRMSRGACFTWHIMVYAFYPRAATTNIDAVMMEMTDIVLDTRGLLPDECTGYRMPYPTISALRLTQAAPPVAGAIAALNELRWGIWVNRRLHTFELVPPACGSLANYHSIKSRRFGRGVKPAPREPYIYSRDVLWRTGDTGVPKTLNEERGVLDCTACSAPLWGEVLYCHIKRATTGSPWFLLCHNCGRVFQRPMVVEKDILVDRVVSGAITRPASHAAALSARPELSRLAPLAELGRWRRVISATADRDVIMLGDAVMVIAMADGPDGPDSRDFARRVQGDPRVLDTQRRVYSVPFLVHSFLR